MQDGEKRIISRLVKDALAAGYTVSVYDGEEWALRKSTKHQEIMKSLGATDDETLVFGNAKGEKIGTVWLVYGNSPWEIIADSSWVEFMVDGVLVSTEKVMDDLLKGANELAEKIEAATPY